MQCSVAFLAFAEMLSINVPLAFVTMSTMPFVYIVGVRMRKQMFPVSWLIQSRLADVATVVDENINGVRVVKSFAAEDAAAAAPDRRGEARRVGERQGRRHPGASGRRCSRTCPASARRSCCFYGGYLAINGQATVGDIVAFNAYVLMLQPPFRQLGMILMMGQRASASAQRIYEVLDEQPDVVDRPGAVDLVECRGDVHFDDVSFAYAQRRRTVLDDFDLHLRPGETVALVGRTGSGKSTAARLLARFYDVTGGAVRIDGHDVRDLTLPSLRHHIGMVLDEPFLFSVSIRDNIAYGQPDASFDEVEAARRGRRRRRVHPRRCPRATTPWSGSAASRSRAGSASGIVDRAHAAGEPADPRARRRHVGHRRADRAADPRGARASSWPAAPR